MVDVELVRRLVREKDFDSLDRLVLDSGGVIARRSPVERGPQATLSVRYEVQNGSEVSSSGDTWDLAQLISAAGSRNVPLAIYPLEEGATEATSVQMITDPYTQTVFDQRYGMKLGTPLVGSHIESTDQGGLGNSQLYGQDLMIRTQNGKKLFVTRDAIDLLNPSRRFYLFS